MRQRRPRSTHLSDNVLTAAAEAGHARLQTRINEITKTEQVTEMTNTLIEQMISPVSVDLRESVTTQVALAERAYKWIRGKSIDGTFVTQGQLASFLKVKKAVVPGVVKTMIGSHYGNEEAVTDLYVFVEKNQVPAWLRELLRHIDVCRLLQRARMGNQPSVMYRLEFQSQLRAMPDFRENLIKVWTHGRNSIVRALYTVGLIHTPDFQQNVDMDWMANPNLGLHIGGNSFPGEDYGNGVYWSLDYGRVSYTQLDKLNFDPHHTAILEYREPKKGARNKPTEEQVAERLQLAQSLVNWMAAMNYQLYHRTMSFSGDGEQRTMLSFAGKSGMGEKVTVRLPWANTVFRIKA
jgi:hypothetical protein